MNRILITGALGHIGSALLRALGQEHPEAEFILVDNLLTERYCSLFDLSPDIKYHFYPINIFDESFQALVVGASVVIHLAAITDMTNSFDTPSEIEKVNFQGAAMVADVCAKNSVPLLFISSTSVYVGLNGEVDESSEISRSDLSPYAESKIQGEDYLKNAHKNLSLKHTTLRFGTIVGPSQGMRFHTAVNKFIWQSVLGNKLTVWETALDQVRPYLSLADAVRTICYTVNGILLDKKEFLNGEVYNVVTENTTVRKIIEVLKLYKPNLEISLVKSSVMNDSSFQVSIKKLSSIGMNLHETLANEIALTFKLLGGIHLGR